MGSFFGHYVHKNEQKIKVILHAAPVKPPSPSLNSDIGLVLLPLIAINTVAIPKTMYLRGALNSI